MNMYSIAFIYSITSQILYPKFTRLNTLDYYYPINVYHILIFIFRMNMYAIAFIYSIASKMLYYHLMPLELYLPYCTVLKKD